jgi:NitT/TauT family transport system ATP-binding protein
MSTPLLSIRGVSKRFASQRGSTLALAQVETHVHEGEIVCIVGSSGCGKSTLLSLVAGLDRPTTGSLTLDGATIAAPGAERGMVFQRDALFPWLTVRGNVRFGLKLRANVTTAESLSLGLDRAEYLIEAVGLGRFADAYPKQLSGGMRQRAAIARALVTQPRILLMDEPFGALDAQTREQMQTLLLKLSAQHRTTVMFVTHDVEEAVFLADRVLVMKPHPGEIVADVKIDLPRPRTPSLKLDAAFSHNRGRILDLIHQPEEAAA